MDKPSIGAGSGSFGSGGGKAPPGKDKKPTSKPPTKEPNKPTGKPGAQKPAKPSDSTASSPAPVDPGSGPRRVTGDKRQPGSPPPFPSDSGAKPASNSKGESPRPSRQEPIPKPTPDQSGVEQGSADPRRIGRAQDSSGKPRGRREGAKAPDSNGTSERDKASQSPPKGPPKDGPPTSPSPKAAKAKQPEPAPSAETAAKTSAKTGSTPKGKEPSSKRAGGAPGTGGGGKSPSGEGSGGGLKKKLMDRANNAEAGKPSSMARSKPQEGSGSKTVDKGSKAAGQAAQKFAEAEGVPTPIAQMAGKAVENRIQGDFRRAQKVKKVAKGVALALILSMTAIFVSTSSSGGGSSNPISTLQALEDVLGEQGLKDIQDAADAANIPWQLIYGLGQATTRMGRTDPYSNQPTSYLTPSQLDQRIILEGGTRSDYVQRLALPDEDVGSRYPANIRDTYSLPDDIGDESSVMIPVAAPLYGNELGGFGIFMVQEPGEGPYQGNSVVLRDGAWTVGEIISAQADATAAQMGVPRPAKTESITNNQGFWLEVFRSIIVDSYYAESHNQEGNRSWSCPTDGRINPDGNVDGFLIVMPFECPAPTADAFCNDTIIPTTTVPESEVTTTTTVALDGPDDVDDESTTGTVPETTTTTTTVVSVLECDPNERPGADRSPLEQITYRNAWNQALVAASIIDIQQVGGGINPSFGQGLPIIPGISDWAVKAYYNAWSLMQTRQLVPGCQIDPATLAGFGKVESGHGTAGRGAPINEELDIRTASGGYIKSIHNGPRHDSGSTFWGKWGIPANGPADQALGPTQFLPMTWASIWRQIGQADPSLINARGSSTEADPHNYYDAALATAFKSCSDAPPLATDDQIFRAVTRYYGAPNSDYYGKLIAERDRIRTYGAWPAPTTLLPLDPGFAATGSTPVGGGGGYPPGVDRLYPEQVAWGGYRNGFIPISAMVCDYNLTNCMHPDAYASYQAMAAAAGLEGITIPGNSYRSYEEQVRMAGGTSTAAAAGGGKSIHGWGLAIDIAPLVSYNPAVKQRLYDSPTYIWLSQNAHKYGFGHPYWARRDNPKEKYREPWHWEWFAFMGPEGSRTRTS